jgi:hypothetical protein
MSILRNTDDSSITGDGQHYYRAWVLDRLMVKSLTLIGLDGIPYPF